MRKLLRMDIYRLFRRKILYVMIVAMSAITLSMLFLNDPSTMTFSSILGVMDGVSMDNFMSAASGLGLVYTVMCIMLSFFVCDDFSSGFAKNIFTVHSKKTDYIAGKIISMVVASGVLMLISLIESIFFCMMSGVTMAGVGGIIIFWIEKWILSAPFAAAILFVSIWLRNKGLGFLFACLLGTGGLVMGIEWGLEAIKFPFAKQVLSWTMYGSSTIPTLAFHIGDFVHIIVAAIVWCVFYAILSSCVLKKKEI